MDSNSKIQAGLEHRNDGQTAGGNFKINQYVGAPTSVSALKASVSTVDFKATKLREMTAGITSAMAAFESRKSAEISNMKSMTAEQRATELARAMREERKRVLSVGAPDRAALRAEILDHRKKALAVKRLFDDPIQLLNSLTLGSDKRGAFFRDLENAGPRECENVIAQAVASGDRDLMAAVIQRIDAMPSNSRKMMTVTRREAAEAIVAEDAAQARTLIGAIDVQADECEIEIARTEGIRSSATDRITLGVKKMQLAGRDSAGAAVRDVPGDAA